jgi:hypothetical protein
MFGAIVDGLTIDGLAPARLMPLTANNAMIAITIGIFLFIFFSSFVLEKSLLVYR